MSRLRKKSATGFQKQVNYKLPEGKGKKRRQIIKIYRQFKYVILISVFLFLVIVLLSIEKIFKPFSVVNVNPTNFSLLEVDKSALIGRKLYLLNQSFINRALLPSHIEIKNFTMIKKYPNTIEVIADKRSGVFKIKNDKSYFIIDDLGVIFKSEVNSKLPDLPIKVHNISIGTMLNQDEFDLYTEVVKGLLNLKLVISSVYLEGNYIFATIDSKYIVRFNIKSYKNEIEMFRKAVNQIDSLDTVKEITFVENKILIQRVTAR